MHYVVWCIGVICQMLSYNKIHFYFLMLTHIFVIAWLLWKTSRCSTLKNNNYCTFIQVSSSHRSRTTCTFQFTGPNNVVSFIYILGPHNVVNFICTLGPHKIVSFIHTKWHLSLQYCQFHTHISSSQYCQFHMHISSSQCYQFHTHLT